MNQLKLCLSCADKYREAFTLTRDAAPATAGKCDHCKKKSYVTKYGVKKKC